MSSQEAISLFLRHAQRLATNTQEHYRYVLWQFYEYLPSEIERTSPEHIENFLSNLKMKNSSKNTFLIPIKSLFHFLNDYYNISNPAVKVKRMPEAPPRQRAISEIEYGKILKVCKPKERAVIRFLANTGLRASEFCSLAWQNVSSDKKYLTFIGKGQKRRIVPNNAVAIKALNTFNFQKNYTRKSLYRLCEGLAKRANIPRFGPHALRHFFCTRMVLAGVPIAVVSRVMGHSSPVVTMKVYLHLLVPDYLGSTDCLDK